jgi:hypothetical protein
MKCYYYIIKKENKMIKLEEFRVDLEKKIRFCN